MITAATRPAQNPTRNPAPIAPPPRPGQRSEAETSERAPSLRYTSHAVTHIGKVRKLNEDRFLCREDAGVWAIADGMGGHGGGGTASKLVMDLLCTVPGKQPLNLLLNEVEERIEKAQAELRKLAWQSNQRIMGTTLVALLLRQGYGVFLWVGDSRLYRLREGRLYQMTMDHSQVFNYISTGMLSPEEARMHPLRNRITRAVGTPDGPNMDLDMTVLQAGDRYLLCTDGLTGSLSDADLLELLGAGGSTRLTCEQLVEKTLEGEALDNVTVVIVDVHKDPMETAIEQVAHHGRKPLRPSPRRIKHFG